MKALLDWFDHRTGIRHIVHQALFENIPGGSRWRYVWGSTLAVAFFVQMVTGIFLWTAYSPGSQSAWESVYFIEYQMAGGWLLRGIHHFMSDAMVILLALHLMQVVIDGAYRAPREINFWIGLILMLLVLGLALTGYLLPWDQKGFWATRVATNLMGLIPGLGSILQKLVVGGPEYGHHTLTRFFALHAGVLPGLILFFLVLHIGLFRRHGICAKSPLVRSDQAFWPDQLLKDVIACLAVLCCVLLITVWNQGAGLGSPADPASPYQAARPEWYFLFLFQFLKYFSGASEVLGVLVVPALVLMVLFSMPLVGRWRLGHRFNVAFVSGLLLGVTFLTYRALEDDYYARWYRDGGPNPTTIQGVDQPSRFATSQDYLQEVAAAREKAKRVSELASLPTGIPASGAISLVRSDPQIQGPKLFKRYCASCHNYADPQGRDTQFEIRSDDSKAPNLYGFATAPWYAGLLDPRKIGGPHYFGKTALKDGDMVTWVEETIAEVDPEEVQQVVQALAAQAAVKFPTSNVPLEEDQIAAGITLIKEGFGCADCHKFGQTGQLGAAPDLTGHGTEDWLADFISDPSQERFYGENNDQMPAFARYPDQPHKNFLSREQIMLLVRWLRRDWSRPAERSSE